MITMHRQEEINKKKKKKYELQLESIRRAKYLSEKQDGG